MDLYDNLTSSYDEPQGSPDQEADPDAGSEQRTNFKVVVRVRPPLARELRGGYMRNYQCTTHVDATGRIATISENLPAVLQNNMGQMDPSMLYATYRFTFDHVYDQDSTQEDLYLRSAQPVVLSILQGYNAAMIAYGQTGTGKTYTVEGDLEGPHRGIIPRTVEDIFTYIVNDPEPTSKYLVRASYLQIYNEVISDLLKPERTNLTIREDKRRGVFVEGLSEWVVRSPGEVYQLMARGQSLRATGATKLNEVSSRSHAVCIIIVEKCTTVITDEAAAALARPTASRDGGIMPPPHNIKVGKLNLVDLAGSERVHVTGAVGKRLEESKKINASLSALGNVIAALTDPRGERTHIPYRDSKLTRLLEDSLGGNCRTTMVCTVAPSMEAFQESLSTLKFANRAKNIKNEAHVNEDLDQKTLLRKYERELRKLRMELQRRSKLLVDKRMLLEAEEQKRRAEADKLAALTALEKRSKEFLKEKEEKRTLEAKIRSMQSQMLVGGVALGPGGTAADAAIGSHGGPPRAPLPGSGNAASWENAPAFKQMVQNEHKRIRNEYEKRLRELEGERKTVENDRLQVDRYKQLLLKQRDIMIALTARLNERDEQIMALQEELEACDKYQQQLEDALDAKTAELIALRKATVEHATSTGQPVREGSTLDNILGAWSGGTQTPVAPLQRRTQMEGAQGAMEVMRLDDATTPGLYPHASSGGASELSPDPQQQRLQAERVDALTAACSAAQRERAALQQILESKVKRMMADMVQEAGSQKANGAGGGGGASEGMVKKLLQLEGVLDKINSAMKAAPPILPPEEGW